MARTPLRALIAALPLCLWVGAGAMAQVVVDKPPAKGERYGTKSEAEEQAGDKLICVQEELTGSHIRRTVCATRAEWQKRRELARQQAKNMQGGCGRQGSEPSSASLGVAGKTDCYGGTGPGTGPAARGVGPGNRQR